jgi:hypothetical protein
MTSTPAPAAGLSATPELATYESLIDTQTPSPVDSTTKRSAKPLAGIIASWSSALGDMDFATGLGHKDREHRTKVRVGQMVHGLTARSESPRVVPRTIMSRLRAIPAVRTSRRPRGSRPMPGPGTGAPSTGRQFPQFGPQPPTARRRYG